MAVEINKARACIGAKMNRIFLYCFGMLLSITCLADAGQKTVLQQLEGMWEGAGIQDDNSRWSIKVTLRPERYAIDYPSLNCGGMLELVKENADSLVFREVLTYGTDGCYNNGKTVLIKTKDHKIRYYWYFENNGKKAAVGELNRLKESSHKS